MKQTKYENYFASKEGDIYSSKGKQIRKLAGSLSNGYRRLTISNKGKSTQVSVHRIVAETYMDNPNNLSQINHIDGNRLNNNIDNLEWCSASSNIKHSYDELNKGSKPKVKKQLKEARVKAGESVAIFTRENASDIIEMKDALKLSNREIANMFNCNSSTIARLVNGTTKIFKVMEAV